MQFLNVIAQSMYIPSVSWRIFCCISWPRVYCTVDIPSFIAVIVKLPRASHCEILHGITFFFKFPGLYSVPPPLPPLHPFLPSHENTQLTNCTTENNAEKYRSSRICMYFLFYGLEGLPMAGSLKVFLEGSGVLNR